MSGRPNAYGWPTPALLTSLARAGWGELAGRHAQGQRAVLAGLVARLPYRSGEGLATAAQVAAASGRSLRWTRVCLAALEEAGVIEWRRGYIDRTGRPRPGWFRVVKAALVAMIEAARPSVAATAPAAGPGTRSRRSEGVALTAALIPSRVSSRAGPPRWPAAADLPPPIATWAATLGVA